MGLSELAKLLLLVFLVVFGGTAIILIIRTKLIAAEEKISFREALEVLAVKDGAQPKNWVHPRDRKKEGEIILPPTIEEELKNKRRTSDGC